MKWPLALALLLVAPPGGSSALAAGPPPLERVGTIALEGPAGALGHLALDAKRGRLYVANTVNGSLDVVDLKAGKLLKQVPGQTAIMGLDYAPDLDRVFAGVGGGAACNIFDGEDQHLLKSLAFGEDADNVRYDPRTRRVFVVHADRELAVVGGEDYFVGSPISLPESIGGLKAEASRPRLYVNAKDAGRVVVVDPEKGRVLERFSVAPAAVDACLAIDEPNRRLFVGCRRAPTLVVMDADSGKVVATVPIPGDVDDVAFDAGRKRIYASCGDGAIAVIGQLDADRYEHLADVPTVKGARTSLFDAESGRLYVAVPRHADRPGQPAPEVWVYQAMP